MMTKKIHTPYLLMGLLVSSLAGCFGLFDSSADRIVGRYNACWIDGL